MIDALAEMLPARTIEVNIRGTTYRLGELTARDYAEMSGHLISRRPHPLDAIKGHLAGHAAMDQQILLGRAFESSRRAPIVTQFELNDFQTSIEGVIYMFWLCARKNHPELTLEATEAVLNPIRPATIESLTTMLDQLHGMPTSDPLPAAGTQSPTPTA